LQGIHAVSLNLMHRLTLALLVTDEEIVLINVGDHDGVYK